MMQLLDILITVAGAINDVLQFIGLVFSILLILFFYTLPYRRPLKKLLGHLGLNFWNMLRVIVKSRRNPRLYIRAFVELSIIRSKGNYNNRRFWLETIKEFQKMLDTDKDGNSFTININTCFDLTCTEVQDAIEGYFQYLGTKKNKKFFSIVDDTVLSFVSDININEGYLSPLVFICGLQDRYNEDWIKIISKFTSVFYDNNNAAISPFSLYFTYTWLMWGPSLQLSSGDGFNTLMQYGYGDESNSICIVSGNNVFPDKNSNNGGFGLSCSFVGKISDKRSYFNLNKNGFNLETSLFINRMLDNETNPCFVVEYSNHESNKSYKTKNYFFSAYIWIMFITEIDGEKKFDINKTITLFEHANIANETNYLFLVNSLLDKTFSFFEDTFSKAENDSKSFRYCLSMNHYIYEKFEERLKEYMNNDNAVVSEPFRKRIKTDTIYTPIEIFNSIDSQFDDTDESNEIIEVDYQDSKSIAYLCEFYANIYLKEFIDPDERESLENLLSYLEKKNRGWYVKNNYHILILLNNGHVVGGIVCDYFCISNSGVVEFIAIDRYYRGQGKASCLYKAAVDILQKDAVELNRKSLDIIFAEVNDPSKLDAKDDVMTPYGRLNFWESLHFRKIEFAYKQPALSATQKSVDCLLLICCILNTKWSAYTIPNDTMKAFIHDYAKLAMRIEIPDENNDIKSMFAELKKTEHVKTVELLT